MGKQDVEASRMLRVYFKISLILWTPKRWLWTQLALTLCMFSVLKLPDYVFGPKTMYLIKYFKFYEVVELGSDGNQSFP